MEKSDTAILPEFNKIKDKDAEREVQLQYISIRNPNLFRSGWAYHKSVTDEYNESYLLSRRWHQ